MDSVVSVYKDKFAMGSYAVVVILCDTEEPPYDDFRRIRKSIADMYGQRICDKILFFVNPCVMQLILSHGSDVRLKTGETRDCRHEAEKFCGIRNYDRAALSLAQYVFRKNGLIYKKSKVRNLPQICIFLDE